MWWLWWLRQIEIEPSEHNYAGEDCIAFAFDYHKELWTPQTRQFLQVETKLSVIYQKRESATIIVYDCNRGEAFEAFTMDPVKMETMESASRAKKTVVNQMSTHVWNLFAKTNLFALCCVGAFLSLVCNLYFFFVIFYTTNNDHISTCAQKFIKN